MSTLREIFFSVARSDDADPLVVPLVDDVPLTDLGEAFEKEHSLEPAGGYGGLALARFDFGPLDSYFLGDFTAGSYWAGIGAIYLLGRQCGEVSCWPLQCHVLATPKTVIWKEFSQPHRTERNYSEFGPFVFDLLQSRAAVARLQSDIQGHRTSDVHRALP